MSVLSPPIPDRSCFTESFIRENALERNGFKKWIFTPGMLFGATDKWWGDQGKRDSPHEGLDLCLYRNGQNQTVRIEGKMKIPVMYDGVVDGILDDFLGKSLIIKHGFPTRDNRRFCTIFGHTRPYAGIEVGRRMLKGEAIAELAEVRNTTAGMISHLHVSMGWLAESISSKRLNWETINDPDVITLLDPLKVLDRDYQLLVGNGIA